MARCSEQNPLHPHHHLTCIWQFAADRFIATRRSLNLLILNYFRTAQCGVPAQHDSLGPHQQQQQQHRRPPDLNLIPGPARSEGWRAHSTFVCLLRKSWRSRSGFFSFAIGSGWRSGLHRTTEPTKNMCGCFKTGISHCIQEFAFWQLIWAGLGLGSVFGYWIHGCSDGVGLGLVRIRSCLGRHFRFSSQEQTTTKRRGCFEGGL